MRAPRVLKPSELFQSTR